MDTKLFEIASKVSTPLGLAGIIAVIVFYLLKQILDRKGNIPNAIIKFIIDKLFILAIVAMCFGFVGWVITKVYASNNKDSSSKKTFNFNVYTNNNPAEGVNVIIDNIFPNAVSTTSNSTGQVTITFDTINQKKYLHLVFKRLTPKIDEIRNIPIDNFPDSFNLSIKEEPSKTPEKKDKNPAFIKPSTKTVTLVNSKLILVTANDTYKDLNTGLRISVNTGDGQKEIGNNNNDDRISKKEFKPNEVYEGQLIIGQNFTKQDCQDFKVKITLTNNRRDKWVINVKIILTFSDGTTLEANGKSLVLENNGDSRIFNASD